MAKLTFSIIIPVAEDNPNLQECLKHCTELIHESFEIIVLPDKELTGFQRGVRVVPTGKKSPSHKRDHGAGIARGKILAFIDDDAYPRKDWLSEAEKEFDQQDVAAVGGPGITPKSDGFWEKASGLVFESILGGGSYRYRYIPTFRQEIDDYPTCNLFVKREDFLEVGGFDTEFWPGEDTKLCLDITKGLGKKMIYSPNVVVYHHRRPLFKIHIRQVISYARHRGYFAKRFPQTSLRPSYFLPTIFDTFLAAGLVYSLIYREFLVYFLVVVAAIYAAFLLSAFVCSKRPLLAAVAAGGCFATHFLYGIFFVIGILSRRLSEENKSSKKEQSGLTDDEK